MRDLRASRLVVRATGEGGVLEGGWGGWVRLGRICFGGMTGVYVRLPDFSKRSKMLL